MDATRIEHLTDDAIHRLPHDVGFYVRGESSGHCTTCVHPMRNSEASGKKKPIGWCSASSLPLRHRAEEQDNGFGVYIVVLCIGLRIVHS